MSVDLLVRADCDDGPQHCRHVHRADELRAGGGPARPLHLQVTIDAAEASRTGDSLETIKGVEGGYRFI